MSISDGDIAFAKELFSAIPALTTRKMFGGLSVYSEGTIFALLRSDGQIMLKAKDGDFADRLVDMGAEKWAYTRKDGSPTFMPYWTLPEAAIDDPELATELARAALDALK